jgi:hypothetical protein
MAPKAPSQRHALTSSQHRLRSDWRQRAPPSSFGNPIAGVLEDVNDGDSCSKKIDTPCTSSQVGERREVLKDKVDATVRVSRNLDKSA